MVRRIACIAALAGLTALGACADLDGYADYGPGYGHGGSGYGGYGYRPSPQPFWGPSYAPAPYWGPSYPGRGYGHPGPFHQGNTSRDPGGFRAPPPAARMAPPPAIPRGPLMQGTGPRVGPRVEQGAD